MIPRNGPNFFALAAAAASFFLFVGPVWPKSNTTEEPAVVLGRMQAMHEALQQAQPAALSQESAFAPSPVVVVRTVPVPERVLSIRETAGSPLSGLLWAVAGLLVGIAAGGLAVFLFIVRRAHSRDGQRIKSLEQELAWAHDKLSRFESIIAEQQAATERQRMACEQLLQGSQQLQMRLRQAQAQLQADFSAGVQLQESSVLIDAQRQELESRSLAAEDLQKRLLSAEQCLRTQEGALVELEQQVQASKAHAAAEQARSQDLANHLALLEAECARLSYISEPKERRTATRFACPTEKKDRWRLQFKDAAGKAVIASLSNVSLSGCCAKLWPRRRLKNLKSVKLIIPKQAKPMQVKASIAWLEETSTQAVSRIGVAFESLAQDSRQQLQKCLEV
jgi:hypothetical protein